MSRATIVGAVIGLAMGAASVVSAGGIYFDAGIGVGGGWTSIDGDDVMNGDDADEVAVELGLKAGYGPISNLPLYLVVDFSGIGHRFADPNNSSNFLQFNSYLVGPGALYYPIPIIQLGASVGLSFIANAGTISGITLSFPDGKTGVAYSISAAAHLPSEAKHGVLVGLKLFGSSCAIDTPGSPTQSNTFLGVFVRYALKSGS